MKNMPKLFDLNLTDPDELKATKFISSLREMGYVKLNMSYLTNYIDTRIDIALSHIRTGYKKYVLEGNWTEEKYKDIVLLITRDRKMMSATTFLQYGMKYDDGKLKREVNLERKKYQNDESQVETQKEKTETISKEEQELLDYISSLNNEK